MNLNSVDLIRNANMAGLAVPAFNIPYLPMMQPVIQALVDEDVFGFVETARLEWLKFEAGGLVAIADEFTKWEKPDYVRLHLDHVPVVDEDDQLVDYLPIIKQAIELGYHSVMIDGSRLELSGNIAATQQVVQLAHEAGIPCEAELGAVLGHETGSLPPYEQLYDSGLGFTDVQEAQRFVQETGCDWLSVAVGNIHGAVSGSLKDQKKIAARLNIDHLKRLHQVTGIPLVLHGGSGVQRTYLLEALRNGITKVNIGMEIRQAYEQALRKSNDRSQAQQACYERTRWLLHDYYELSGTRDQVLGQDQNKIQ